MLRKKRHCFVTCGVILRFVFYTRTRDTLIMTIVTIFIVVEVTFSASQHTNRKMFFLNCVNCVDIIVICCGILGLVLFVTRFDHHVREYAECKWGEEKVFYVEWYCVKTKEKEEERLRVLVCSYCTTYLFIIITHDLDSHVLVGIIATFLKFWSSPSFSLEDIWCNFFAFSSIVEWGRRRSV